MAFVFARITARPGSADAMREILTDLVAPTRLEPGCLKYELFQREGEPEIFYTSEEWRDAADVDAHMATPHVAAAIAAGTGHFGAPPEIKLYKKLA
jgi:quinol monooxygenase YgiN